VFAQMVGFSSVGQAHWARETDRGKKWLAMMRSRMAKISSRYGEITQTRAFVRYGRGVGLAMIALDPHR
jgi:ABC-type Fe3+-hydroxamate transport system substrate-binding protein